MPLVSFVVPCFNYARFLPDCLDSIINLKDNNEYEIIIIDDASTDNVIDVMKKYRDPRLKFIQHQTNTGVATTLNEAIKVAQGEFIARIDPDDRYRSHFLTTVLKKFDEHPEAGLVYGDVALIDESGLILKGKSDIVHGGKDCYRNELIALLELNFIPSPSAIARREAIIGIPPVPSWSALDDWYCTVMMARRWNFCFINNVIAEYRVHQSNYHSKIVQDYREELSLLGVLDTVFSTDEISKDLQQGKLKRKRAIYASQYLTLANKYFGNHLNKDARRCYWKAVCTKPSILVSTDMSRRFFATIIGRGLYDRAKLLAKPSALAGH